MGKITDGWLFPGWLMESISLNWNLIPERQPLESRSVGGIFTPNEFRGYNE